MLSVKQGGIKYYSLSLWYDLTWDWTQVFRAISEQVELVYRVYYLVYKMMKWNSSENQ